VGIAPRADAASYLNGVAHDQITRGTGGDDIRYQRHPGGRPDALPGSQTFWAASGSGNVEWDVRPGDWTIVIMNADGTSPVAADLKLAATLPWLAGLTAGLFIATAILLFSGTTLILIGVRLAAAPAPERRQPAPTS